MERPKLSIITVNLNNASGLLKTIESVIQQTNRDFEFIVIDGGSSDGSAELVTKYKREFTYSISEKDTGIYNSMNKGILKSKGEYLLFLNSGDWLHNNTVINDLLPLLKDFDVISGNIDIYDKGKWHFIRSEDSVNVPQLLKLSLYHQTTFIKRKLFEEYGLYNENFKLAGDYEFFIRVLLKFNASYHYIDLTTTNYIADGISNKEEYSELNKQESAMAWKMNFSERVLTALKENEAFNESSVYWLFNKTETSGIYRGLFSLIYSVRYKMYQLFKRRQ